MSSIVVSGDTSGSVTLQAPAVAGSTVLTLPATSGTVLTSVSPQSSFPPNIAGNGPAFRIYATATTSVPNGTPTKVILGGTTFDTTSGMVASSRFTPTVAGYYQVNFGIRMENVSTVSALLFKNGTSYSTGSTTGNPALAYNSSGADLVYLNGSTDYIELYAYHAGTGTQTVTASSTETKLSAFLARSA